MDGWMGGWVDGWMVEWMDAWMDGIDVLKILPLKGIHCELNKLLSWTIFRDSEQ